MRTLPLDARTCSGAERGQYPNKLGRPERIPEGAVTLVDTSNDRIQLLSHADDRRVDVTLVFSGDEPTRVIDRLATLTALEEDVSFRNDKEGLLGIRVARQLEAPDDTPTRRTAADGSGREENYADSEGVNGLYRSSTGLEGDPVWATRGDWVKLSGTLRGETVSLVILDHPANPGYPTYWHARGYGLFAANTLGQAAFSEGKDTLDFKLAAGESATFRYRVLIHSPEPVGDEWVNERFRVFAAG
ncbi:MAG: hypothetical protein GW911_12985 [Armatimonadetes bacterium]|nr:hypothetical protein [Armatimonadota bacterium]NCO93056.1 hypothetical protein [Armatimonadota bacterium]NCP29323.1 hypothetical protein [Armatimonadota bacterium]NCQ29050.1 hypothetical protein [Armatimonadota bacterium]NDK12947.1 hypothetical protein [Armatimonadota bacterium]